MIFHTRFPTRLWDVILAGDAQGLTHLHLCTEQGKREFVVHDTWEQNDPFFDNARQQICDFLAGQRKTITIPINPQGTEFQRNVWKTLQTIPYGQTRTYRDIAHAMGKPNAARAVGMANSRNPIPLIVPCHRVIGSNGRLTGFAHGLDVKRKLLEMEKMAVGELLSGQAPA